ncbi:MAG: phosphatidylglycerophosphatase A [Phycisphaeraceae bacterium]|nr:phosphatidylglycerophosphatase A [Phycisphaeraceae bacterium]
MRLILITCFGTGLFRPASGTWGSMPAAALAWALLLLGAPQGVYIGVLAAWFVVFSVACVVFGEWAEAKFGKKDAGQIVADEAAGQCIPLFLLATIGVSGFQEATLTVGAAFVLFRIFDVIKPPPANAMQKLHAGWGVLVDDLFAGLYAAIALDLGLWILSSYL